MLSYLAEGHGYVAQFLFEACLSNRNDLNPYAREIHTLSARAFFLETETQHLVT